MAIADAISLSSQYYYNNNGPLDAKSLVDKFELLTSADTWKDQEGNIIAYNGMLVAVWRERNENAYKNGIYFFHDGTTKRLPPVESIQDESNWHKLTELSDIADFESRLSALENAEQESDVITYGYREGFPVEGEEGKLYIAADEKKSYVWFNGEYLAVGGSDGSNYEEPDVIYGGSAD
jgi:hypothetical protein